MPADPSEPDLLADPKAILAAPEAAGRVVRGGALRIAATGANLALNLVGAVLMIRRLGAADDPRYGLFISLSALSVVALTLADGGLQQLGAREYIHAEPARRQAVLRDLLGIRVALLTPAILLVGLVAGLTKQDPTLVFGALLAAGGQALMMAQQTMSVPLQTTLNLGLLALVDLVRGIVGTALIAVLFVANTSLLPYFGVQLVAGLVAIVVMLIAAPATRALPDLAGGGWRRFLVSSLPFAVAAAAGVVYFRLGAWLVDLVSSPHQANAYAIAFRTVEALTAIPAILIGAVFPVLASAIHDRRRLSGALQTSFDASLATGVPLALAVIVGAPVAVSILAHDTPGAGDAVTPLRLLGIALATSFLVYSWSYTLLALARYRALTIVSTVAAVVVAVGCAFLGHAYGATGTAVATILGEVTVVAGAAIALGRYDRTLLPNPRFATRVAVAFAVGIIPFLAGLTPWLALPLSVATYSVAAVVLRAVPPQVLGALPGFARLARGSGRP